MRSKIWNKKTISRLGKNVLQDALRQNGYDLKVSKIHKIGGRSLLVEGVEIGKSFQLVVLQQRCWDPRIVCPLDEEHSILKILWEVSPGIAPEPIAFLRAEDELETPLMVLRWVTGTRLDSLYSPRTKPELVLEKLSIALSILHEVGRQVHLSAMSRHIDACRLVREMGEWQFHNQILPTKQWDRVLMRIEDVIEQLTPPTLLHCDPHVYNLLMTENGWCWLDFEKTAVGPSEFDNAHAWILLHMQARQAIIPQNRTLAQSACDLLAAASFLNDPPCGAGRGAIRAVVLAARSAAERLG